MLISCFSFMLIDGLVVMYVLIDQFTSDIDLSSMTASSGKGFQIFGAKNGDGAGHRVAVADVDGDGVDDVVVLAWEADPMAGRDNAGSVYCIWGSRNAGTYILGENQMLSLLS